MKELQFPKGFLWGAATSSYQIEGGLINDWSQWEKSPQRVAWLKKRGRDPKDYQSGQGMNSWEQLEADIACLKKINVTSYRFSIEWSRVEPEEGRFDQAAINRYASFIARLREEGIEPLVTLWHWPLPLWLKAKGGWESKKISANFTKYTEKLVNSFPTVKFWCTLNEPEIFAAKSYLIGEWPPQKKNPILYLRVLKNLAKAHCAVYDVIKKELPASSIGIASDNVDFEAATLFDRILILPLAKWLWNYRFLDKIKDKQDFIGLNFYFHHRLFFGFSKNKNERLSEMGWELYPQGIYSVLKDLAKRYDKPIYIMENGLADEADKQRAWYIQEILKSVHKAISDGVDVRGYSHWSLIDNFEWAEGFTKKFGLFAVDRKTFKRTARPSAEIYARICKENQVSFPGLTGESNRSPACAEDDR